MKDIVIAIIGSGAFSAAVSGIIAFVNGKATAKREAAKASKEDYAKLADGIESLLRAEIFSRHKLYVGQGFCPPDEKQMVRDCYQAYHGLGGNDIATKYYNEILDLPEYYMR